jgi:hypothetical protein
MTIENTPVEIRKCCLNYSVSYKYFTTNKEKLFCCFVRCQCGQVLIRGLCRRMQPFNKVINFLYHGITALVDQGLLIIEDSWSHSDTPHSVTPLWTSDQSDAATSAWQHTTIRNDRHIYNRRDTNARSQQGSGLRPRGYRDRLKKSLGKQNEKWRVFNIAGHLNFKSCSMVSAVNRRKLNAETRCSCRPVCVGFVLDKVAVEQVFLWLVCFTLSVSFQHISKFILSFVAHAVLCQYFIALLNNTL